MTSGSVPQPGVFGPLRIPGDPGDLPEFRKMFTNFASTHKFLIYKKILLNLKLEILKYLNGVVKAIGA